MTKEDVAKVCHEANRALCETQGDQSQPAWEDAPDWQKESAIKGVAFHLDNPGRQPEDSHVEWMKEKLRTGWTYGPVKDAEKKEHPCMVPYSKLPLAQRVKDSLFIAVCDALRDMVTAQDVQPKDVDPYTEEVVGNKELRVYIDEAIQQTKRLPGSRERSLAITKLQEAVMWLGMDLKRLGGANPYPNSRDMTNTTIDPTADGLKL